MDLVAHPVVPVALAVSEAVRLVVAMPAPAGSAAIHDAVPGHQAVGRAAIVPLVIDRVSVVRGPVSAPCDQVARPRVRRVLPAAAIVGRLVLASANRIARQADLGLVVQGPVPADPEVLVPQGQRLIGPMSPRARAMVLTVGSRDASHCGRTSCRFLNSGH